MYFMVKKMSGKLSSLIGSHIKVYIFNLHTISIRVIFPLVCHFCIQNISFYIPVTRRKKNIQIAPDTFKG